MFKDIAVGVCRLDCPVYDFIRISSIGITKLLYIYSKKSALMREA